jgi:hypothetical protein
LCGRERKKIVLFTSVTYECGSCKDTDVEYLDYNKYQRIITVRKDEHYNGDILWELYYYDKAEAGWNGFNHYTYTYGLVLQSHYSLNRAFDEASEVYYRATGNLDPRQNRSWKKLKIKGAECYVVGF